MLDVHAPHGKVHGTKDFFVHLFTITIGLLIALSLEGVVEWRHHRNLVHEASAGLRSEIDKNTARIDSLRQQISAEQKELDQDLDALEVLRAHPEQHKEMSFTFRLQGFEDTAWKTAQTTGAFAYMSYQDAREYSRIYDTQSEIYKAQQQVMDEAMSAASLTNTKSDTYRPSSERIDMMSDRIGLIKLRLLVLNIEVNGLDKIYQNYRSSHLR
jgi:hypothetical protein